MDKLVQTLDFLASLQSLPPNFRDHQLGGTVPKAEQKIRVLSGQNQ
jgi:mRNA-degrading endonuclease YafQ of YafQ-DinJ toxin-antitoxin module